MGDDEPQESAQVLYATTLPAFIAARNERVRELRAAGHDAAAREVAAFTKPSAGAGAVNRLIRHDQQLADDIVDLGGRMRAAQTVTPGATELRALDQERRAVVKRARDAARRADDGATAATLDHVEQTIWAAVVDARAAAIVLAGVLVRPLSPGGFGAVDTDGASAVAVKPILESAGRTTPRAPRRRRSDGDDRAASEHAAKEAEQARKRAEQAVRAAQESHRAAQHAVEQAVQEADEAQRRRTDLERTRDELREEIARVEQSLRESSSQITARSATLRDADKHRRQAASEVDRSVERLDRL